MPDNHTDDGLLELAYPYALDAVSESERHDIVGRLGSADPQTARSFGRIVADVHETMGLIGVADTVAPPPRVRENLLAAIDESHMPAPDDLERRRIERRRRRITRVVVAAAAAVAIGLGAAAVTGQFTTHTPSEPTVAQVMASPDTHTATADVAGGTITVSASAHSNAVVVSMENVPPPPAGHVYQMWFMPPAGAPRSAGTMSASTMPPPGGEVVPALDSATSVAVTVEPGTGSDLPTSAPVVMVPLT